MRARKEQRSTDKRRKGRVFLPVVCALAVGFSFFTFTAFAGQRGGQRHAQAPHTQAPRYKAPRQEPHQQTIPSQNQAHPQPAPEARPQYNAQQFNNRQAQPGHLPEWLNQHQNMTPQQRENALRKEPGFNHLPQDQQQRLINRMHTLDSAPPQQRQRMLQRQEMFERLSPEQKAGVRGASQAFHQMPADRQTDMKRAFQDLRAIPPDQRQSVLNSARFQQQFSPQERTVLGNLLSVEPYQPSAAGPK